MAPAVAERRVTGLGKIVVPEESTGFRVVARKRP
jgi:hypothetical protein